MFVFWIFFDEICEKNQTQIINLQNPDISNGSQPEFEISVDFLKKIVEARQVSAKFGF